MSSVPDSVHAVDDNAAAVRLQKTCDNLDGGGLPGSVRAYEAKQLSFFNCHAEPVQSLKIAVFFS